ncbi:MAG: HEAT repeat domain-containing protein [Chloroflexota bacterium]
MKIRFFLSFIFTLAFMFLAACGQTSADRTLSPFRITLTHEAATFKPPPVPDPEDILKTMMAYESHYTPQPLPPTPLSPTITPALPKSVQSICLNVEQTFGQFDGLFPPAKDIAARILQNSHYSVMEIGGNCDATLDIQLILWPLSEQYSNLGGSGSSTCYTGAKATGSATMTLPGKTPQTIEILQVRPPTTGIMVIISTCPGPSNAPFTYPVNNAILQALTQLAGPQILLSAVKDEDERIRVSAVWDLWDLYYHEKYPIPMPVLLEALEDPSSDVRYHTVVILGQMEKEADSAFDKLVSMLQDPEARVRAVVVSSLGRIKPNGPALLDPLITALKDSDRGVYSSALSELRRLGSSGMQAVPDILTFYETHPNEKHRVLSCLREITGQDLGDDPAAWRTWWDQRQ